MNERIEHITKQVDAYFDDLTIEFSREAWQAKFAELIVKEMLQTCEDHPAWTGRMISEEIKQHFGVEE